MITEQQLQEASQQKDDAEKIIHQYHKEKREAFEERLKTNPVFNDSELVYSAVTLCPCGHGLAYPKDCGPNHYWDCSAILRGIADRDAKHTGQLPFAFYAIKAEGENSTSDASTRGVFRPQER